MTDDRQTCAACAHLDPHQPADYTDKNRVLILGTRRCRAAARRELPFVASRVYSPVLDVPRRCEGFKPKPGDADQRNGRERWPSLLDGGDLEARGGAFKRPRGQPGHRTRIVACTKWQKSGFPAKDTR